VDARTPEVSIVSPGRLHVRGADYEGVIVEGGRWTPSPFDVAELERALGPALAAHAMGKDFAPTKFKREYTGILADRRRMIEVHLACHADGWPVDSLGLVKGGGTCYGTVRYDVQAGRLLDVRANANK
jgi:hypothetical protein